MRSILFNGAIFGIGFYLLYLTTKFPRPQALADELTAAFWPRVLLAGLLLSSGFLLVRSIMIRVRESARTPSGPEKPADAGQATGTLRLVVAVLMTAAYVFLLDVFGFAILTIVFLVFFLYIMGLRAQTFLFTLPPAVTAATIVVFAHLMKVGLPRGTGIFRKISLLFY